MRRWGLMGLAEVMPALSHGWWKGWGGRKPLTAEFRETWPRIIGRIQRPIVIGSSPFRDEVKDRIGREGIFLLG